MASVRLRRCKGKKGAMVEVWVVEWTDAKRKRHRHTPRPNTKAAADKLARKLEKDPHLSNRFLPITVKDVCMNWLRHIEQRYEDGDNMSMEKLRQNWSIVFKNIIPYLGDLKAADLSPIHVQEFSDMMRDKRRGAKSPIVIRNTISVLGRALTEAQRLEIIPRNVVKDVPPHMPKIPKASIEVPDRSDLRQLLNNADGAIGLMVRIAIFTGLRVGEIRALMWPQIDFEKNLIHVKHSATPRGKIKTPKTKAGNRTVPIPPMLTSELRKWKIANISNRMGFLFPNSRCPAELAISQTQVQNLWRRLKVKSEVKPIHFHALRHAAASLFIETGLSPQRLKVLMGHANINMTFDTYGYLFPDDGAAHIASTQVETTLLNGVL